MRRPRRANRERIDIVRDTIVNDDFEMSRWDGMRWSRAISGQRQFNI